MTTDTSFDEFVDLVVEKFWSILDQSLESVRTFINFDFRDSINEILNKLESDTADILRYENNAPLTTAISRTRNTLGVTISNIASWFAISREIERPNYDFDVAVEVAVKSVNNCQPNREITFDRQKISKIECRGRTLESIVYILFTLFDNAIHHCGIEDRGPNCDITAVLNDDICEISVVNECSPVENFKLRNEEFQQLRATHVGDAANILVAKEGKSGFPKIHKILKYDLSAKYDIDFGYIDEGHFRATIMFESKAIIK